MQITTVGLDLAKNVFQVHGVNRHGKVELRKQLKRDHVAARGHQMIQRMRWYAPSHLAPSAPEPSGRYLSFAEREQIALARARGDGVRAIARLLGRSASTISRELRRNAATRSGSFDYRAHTAQWHADRRQSVQSLRNW